MFKKRKTSYILFLGFGLFLFSCTKSVEYLGDPKGRLTEYISKSFSVRALADKGVLSSFLTGNVKERLSGWSDDQFRDAFLNSKREFVKLVFREVKEISSVEVQITYELTYLDQGNVGSPSLKNHEAKVTNKKLCQMVLERGKWMVSDVRNIKELVEYKNELSLP